MTSSELRSFPPINDTIDFVKQVDWKDVRNRIRNGFRNLLLVAIVSSEKSYEFHQLLLSKLDGEDAVDALTDEQIEKITLEETLEPVEFPSVRK